MAKKAYIGVDGIARKIRRGYVGVDGVARRIKKAYIGVGGVARPCWSGGELTYYGELSPLSEARMMMAAATAGDVALFTGGQTASGGRANAVDAYNKARQKTVAPALTTAKYSHAATSTIDGAYFGFGVGGAREVEFYNKSLQKTTCADADVGRNNLAAATVGVHAVFAGGIDAYNKACTNVDAYYNNGLSRTIPSQPLSKARGYLGGVGVGAYAIFAGGTTSTSSSDRDNTVDAYTSSLSRTIAEPLMTKCPIRAATRVGDFALFLSDNTAYYEVHIYHKSLSTTVAARVAVPMGSVKKDMAATTVESFAIFATGQNGGNYHLNSFVFDDKLNQTIGPSLKVGRRLASAATVGDYALFAGGGESTTKNTVEAYAVM